MHVASCPILRPRCRQAPELDVDGNVASCMHMGWLVLARCALFHGEQETLAGWSFTASFISGVDYTSTIEFIHQVVVVVVGCSVATSNDACVRGIRGYFRPRRVVLRW